MILIFPNKKESRTRSPLKASPLRNAGQSLEEEIHRIISEDVGSYAALVGFSIMLALYEWSRWLWNSPPHPVAVTGVAFCLSAYAFKKGFAARRKVRLLRQARDGEKAVGQYLEALREKGYRIFHDLIGENFNIDHVLIGTGGVFTVETKTISKPAKGTAEIAYDGESLTVGGFTPDRDPIVQAKAQAKWLQDLIAETTGKILPVRPVVLYPGWFITKQPKGAEVWVLNPKSLPAFLDHVDVSLPAEDVKLIAYHLSRYVRGS